jgi:hypothetical protein
LNIEDAIRIIKGLDTSNSEENIEAKKMAVKALEKQRQKKIETWNGQASCPRCKFCGQALDWSDEQWNKVQTHAGVQQRSSRTKRNIMLLWQSIRLTGRKARSFIGQHTRQES